MFVVRWKRNQKYSVCPGEWSWQFHEDEEYRFEDSVYLCFSHSNECFMCIILFISLNILVSLEFDQRSRITVSNIRDLFEELSLMK